MSKNIMIVGVGGQGSLLASKVLGSVLLDSGYAVKLSEVHGMSQRGGSVVTYVKFGDAVYSPTVDLGEADFIVSFEALEAARWLPYLRRGGKLITSTQRIYPMPVITGAMAYPSDVVDKLSAKADVVKLDALALAKSAGNVKAVNLVLLGVLSRFMEIPLEKWNAAIAKNVPQKLLDVNLRAFALGRDA